MNPADVDHLTTARRALADGETGHAAHHLAAALHHDGLADLRDDVDALLGLAGDEPLRLVELDDKSFFGLAVLRMLMLERLGRWAEATTLLLAIQGGTPGANLLPWLSRWPRFAEAVAALDVDRFARQCLQCLEEPSAAALLAPTMAFVLERGAPHGNLAFATVRALRLAGRSKEALHLAEEQHERAPSYWTAIALAATLREARELERALDAFRAAAACDAEDDAVRLDIADCLLDLGRPEDADGAYAEALALAPDNGWALASREYLRALDGDAAAERRLEAAARSGPADSRAADLYARLSPFALALRPPPSAVINMTAHALARDTKMQSIATSSLEPPSALLAMRRALHARGWPEVQVSMSVADTPDPREPLGPVDVAVWTYAPPGLLGQVRAPGLDARPALPEPPTDVLAAVSELAAREYGLEAWCEAARAYAHAWGPERARSILGAMATPPALAGLAPWEAIFRAQVAAALIVAFLETGPARDEALRSLLFGPVDWTSAATIVALTAAARVDATRTHAVIELLQPLLAHTITPIRYQCLHSVLVPCLLALPGLPGSLRAELLRRRREFLLAG
jgi:tetratricopeptide (TPR) repeat protein